MKENTITRQTKGLFLYPGVNVKMTYQNFGSTWLGILRGSTENIESVFNGLYNLGATGGKLSFCDHQQTIANFWTSEQELRKFFYNRKALRIHRDTTRQQAQEYAKEQMEALRGNCHECFMDFETSDEIQEYSMGTTKAENPDADFKDTVLANAFKDKSE